MAELVWQKGMCSGLSFIYDHLLSPVLDALRERRCCTLDRQIGVFKIDISMTSVIDRRAKKFRSCGLNFSGSMADWKGGENQLTMAMPGDNQNGERSVSERLKAATDELQVLEKLVVSGCNPRVLGEFRSAVDSMRQTAWAVQQWTELQGQHRDPYTVLGVLSQERVRRATQIAKDLTIDLESLELGLETEGLANLYQAVEGLCERMAPLFKKSVG